MKKTKTQKTFDCLEFKRKVQADLYERTRHMTPEEEVAWYREQAASGPFRNLVRSMKRSSS